MDSEAIGRAPKRFRFLGTRNRRPQQATAQSVLFHYGAAVALAALAQIARLPLRPPTLMPYITFVPFIVGSAAFGGLGPGLVTTVVCAVECIYFAVGPLASFAVSDNRQWLGVAILTSSGVVTSFLFEHLARTKQQVRDAYAELAAIHANAPAILFVLNEDLRAEKVNDLAARLAGLEPLALLGARAGGVLGCVNSLNHPRGCGYGTQCPQCSIRRAVEDTLMCGTPHEGVEAWLTLLNGQRLCFLVSTAALHFGATTKVLVCAQNITEVKRVQMEAEHQREKLERQAQLINLSHDAIIVANSNREILSWNCGAQELYGWAEPEALGRVLHELLQTSDRVSIDEIDGMLRRETRWDGELHQIGRDGREIVVQSRQILMRDVSGNECGILEINRDITEGKHSQAALQESVVKLEAALKQKTVLLKEIHHRVKNNLAVISSLLRMQAQTAASSEARFALDESDRRVHSIALIHEHLYDDAHLDRVYFPDYARELVSELSSIFLPEPGRLSMDVTVGAVELEISEAVPCGMILNELLCNAFKYAFPDGRPGHIGLVCENLDFDFVKLTVYDDGIGLPLDFDWRQAKSLGFQIVQILAKQIHATVNATRDHGTRFELTFPRRSA